MADASYPDDLRYHEEHDWVRLEGDTATFGITWYAQDALGEVVFGDPPEAINNDPYGSGWMVKVRLSDPSEADDLLDAASYESSLT
jgi:glycine cleavage system H protein